MPIPKYNAIKEALVKAGKPLTTQELYSRMPNPGSKTHFKRNILHQLEHFRILKKKAYTVCPDTKQPLSKLRFAWTFSKEKPFSPMDNDKYIKIVNEMKKQHEATSS